MPRYHVFIRRDSVQVYEVDAADAQAARAEVESGGGVERRELEDVESVEIEGVELADEES